MDPLSKEERSALMSKVRSKGAKSTEKCVESALVDHGIGGWTLHAKNVPGSPDFYFAEYRLALFVDGCFWHACPRCGRIPKSRVEFWSRKIAENRRRDERTRRRIRRSGYHVMRVWEHEARKATWLPRLRALMTRIKRKYAEVTEK
jgi:DNA mismatch endonuclease, patch repair protein